MSNGHNPLAQVRLEIPYHLRNLARAEGEIRVELAPPITLRRVLDALEAAHPALGGTIRTYETGERRPFLRFFVCGEDWSAESLDRELPAAISEGREALLIIGAIAGG